MTPKERAVMQQALELLEEAKVVAERYQSAEKREQAITALKEALAEQAEQRSDSERMEPVALAWEEGYRQGIEDERTSEANIGICGFNAKVEPDRQNPYKTSSQPVSQEPVAWGWATADGEIVDCICPDQHDITEGYYTIPLYAAPVRTKDLTDAEIADIGTNCGTSMWSLMFARAVIAADREKNK